MSAASTYDTRAAYENSESSVVDRNYAAYCRARDNGHKKYVGEAKTFDRYYYGDQWDEATLSTLAQQRRPAQTINLALSTINAIIGAYLQQQQDIDIKPVNADANEATATALRKIIRHITYDSGSRNVERQIVTDGLIQDRGYVDIRLDFSENVFGEIRETHLDPLDVMLDPGARDYDPRTWSEVIVSRWLTPDQIEENYGRAIADKLRFIDEGACYGLDSIELDPDTFSMKKSYFSSGPDGGPSYQDDWRQVKRVRLIDRQYFKLAVRRFFVDDQTGDTSPVPDDWSDERTNAVIEYAAARGSSLSVIKRTVRRVRWTVTLDKISVHDGWSPYKWFTVVPFFPYFRRGRPLGVMRNLIGTQDILNKTVSQELHIVNTTANSGWVIQSGALTSMTPQQLEEHGAKTGLVVEYNRGFDQPEKIQPNQVPTGLDRISSKTVMYFREISGVSEAMLGQMGREISGAALENKQQRGLVQLSVVFANLALTRQIRGEIILGMVQDFYTDTRVMKITGVGEEGEQVPEDVGINVPNEVGEIVNDVTLGEYKIVVTSAPARDTEEETELDQMLRARELGVVVPDWAVIESMNIPNRKELADWSRRMQGAAEPTEEEIEAARMEQELAFQTQIAALDELRAKAMERQANAMKLMAEAEALPEQMRVEGMKFAAQMRSEMESQIRELQKSREDLMARIAIMKEKSGTQRYQANLQALTKRLDIQAKERIAASRGVTRVAAAKAK